MTHFTHNDREQQVLHSALRKDRLGPVQPGTNTTLATKCCVMPFAIALPPKDLKMAAALPRVQSIEELHIQQFQQDEPSFPEAQAENQKWAPNLIWREKVVQWSYDVADHLNEERSVVYVAINILDRYCASKASEELKMDEKAYEIASLSAIFLAVRIAGSGNLLISELVSMSRGGITTQDIISTGTAIVHQLRWEYKIITPIEFVKSFLKLLPSSRCGILDSATYLTEIAVCDVVLSHSKASFLAIAACLNVLRSDLPSAIPGFVKAVRDTTAIEAESDEIQDLCVRLAGVYARSTSGDSHQVNQIALVDSGPHIIEDDCDDDEDYLGVSTSCKKSGASYYGLTSKRSCDSLDTLCAEVTQDEKRTKHGL